METNVKEFSELIENQKINEFFDYVSENNLSSSEEEILFQSENKKMIQIYFDTFFEIPARLSFFVAKYGNRSTIFDCFHKDKKPMTVKEQKAFIDRGDYPLFSQVVARLPLSYNGLKYLIAQQEDIMVSFYLRNISLTAEQASYVINNARRDYFLLFFYSIVENKEIQSVLTMLDDAGKNKASNKLSQEFEEILNT